MKRRGHIYPFICLVTITLSLAAAAVAGAQGFMPPPPPVPVPSVQPYPLEAPYVPAPPGTRCSLMAGRFYVQGGVRYRSVDSLRFDIIGAQQSLVFSPGTVPFGPPTPGDFGVGTGIPGFVGDPLALVQWVYDNGQLSNIPDPGTFATSADCPFPPFLNPAIATVCATPPPTFCNCDEIFAFSPARPLIGRVHGTINGGCCDGSEFASSIGSFSMVDTISQVNSANIGTTTAVTFQVGIPDSLAFIVNTTPSINWETGPKLWSPNFEMGYQLTNFFDVFSSFSWFTVSKSVGILNVLLGNGARTSIVDTFPFTTDDFENNWPVANFNSSELCVAGNCFLSYQLAVNSPLRGVFPNRQFSATLDATVPAETIQETVNNRVDIDVYETRFGGRSWVPLYGLGRLGVYLGGSFLPAYYKISTNRNYVSQGPTVPGANLFHVSTLYKDWRGHWGAFVGSDLELGNGIYYINGSIDYTWATKQTFQFDAVETTFVPGGYTAGASIGLHF